MEKVKYVSLKKINGTLTESLKDSRVKPKNKIKTACFEAVSKRFVLDESINHVLDSTINSVLSTFEDREGNNEKVKALEVLFNKLNPLGEFDRIPALKKALTSLIGSREHSASNDELRSLLILWLDYLGASDEKQNPLLKLNREISMLNNTLGTLKGNKFIQGEGRIIDKLLDGNGIIAILNSLSKKLFDHLHGFKSKIAQPVSDRVFGEIEDFNKIIEPETNKVLNKSDKSKEYVMECVLEAFKTILHM